MPGMEYSEQELAIAEQVLRYIEADENGTGPKMMGPARDLISLYTYLSGKVKGQFDSYSEWSVCEDAIAQEEKERSVAEGTAGEIIKYLLDSPSLCTCLMTLARRRAAPRMAAADLQPASQG